MLTKQYIIRELEDGMFLYPVSGDNPIWPNPFSTYEEAETAIHDYFVKLNCSLVRPHLMIIEQLGYTETKYDKPVEIG
jgi:hypothetical protein